MIPRSILVIQLRALGDTVLLTAPLLELIQRYPESKIDVIVSRPYHSLLDGFPGIREVIPYERQKRAVARTRAIARLGYQLRKKHYDWVINFHASPSSALLAFATGAKIRSIHFHDHHQKNRYSTVIIPGKGTLKPIIERHMDTLRGLGLSISTGRLPELLLSQTERREAQAWVQKEKLNFPVLGISLAASRPSKRWPEASFVSLIQKWMRERDSSVVIFYGPNESETVDHLKHLLNKVQVNQVVFAPALPLRLLSSVLSQMSVLVTADTGLKHMAVAVGTPTLTLFGPEHPFEWHPYPLDVHPYLMIENLACRKDAAPGMPPWCALTTCVIENQKCMKLITVDEVFKTCTALARVSQQKEFA